MGNLKPIDITLSGLRGQSGMILIRSDLYIATITVELRMDDDDVEKYKGKDLTLKDLNDIIEGRK
jgi:hypothetical protein